MVKIYANNALTYSKVTKLLALKVVLTHVAVNAEVTARIFIKDSGGGWTAIFGRFTNEPINLINQIQLIKWIKLVMSFVAEPRGTSPRCNVFGPTGIPESAPPLLILLLLLFKNVPANFRTLHRHAKANTAPSLPIIIYFTNLI